MDIKISNKYKVCKKIAEGAFGILYQGINVKTNEEVAIKLESINCRHPQLQYESKLLEKLQNSPGFANILWSGIQGDYYVMVLDLLGPSLQDLFEFCGEYFSTQQICWVASQILQRIQCLHEQKYIHRDIKPENFLIGQKVRQKDLFVIDFGLSKRYECPKTGKHNQHKQRNHPTGTLRYCSINAHKSCEQSRKDDLESIGFVLIYFAKRGILPWMGHESMSHKKQAEMKQNLDLKTYLADCPSPIYQYMKMVQAMSWDQQPDYEALINLFQSHLKELGFKKSFKYDWIVKKENILKEKKLREEHEFHECQKAQIAKLKGKKLIAKQNAITQQIYQKQQKDKQLENEKEIRIQKRRIDQQIHAKLQKLQNSTPIHQDKIKKERSLTIQAKIEQKCKQMVDHTQAMNRKLQNKSAPVELTEEQIKFMSNRPISNRISSDMLMKLGMDYNGKPMNANRTPGPSACHQTLSPGRGQEKKMGRERAMSK